MPTDGLCARSLPAKRSALLCWSSSFESSVLQHRLRVRWFPAPRLIHLRQILCVSARQHHLAKPIAVRTRKAAVIDKPLVGIVGQHLRPQVGVVASAVAITAPNMAEIRGAISRRHVTDLEMHLLECLLFELVG